MLTAKTTFWLNRRVRKMDLRLAGKSVVVTGGASNIGRAITLGFSAECADITVTEIDLEQGEAVAEQARTARCTLSNGYAV